MEATPVRALHWQHKLVVAGHPTGCTSPTVGGYGSNATTSGGGIGSGASTPVRFYSQPVQKVSNVGGIDRIQLRSRATQAVQAPLDAAAATSSPFKLDSLELRMNALNLRNEQLTEEMTKIKDRFANEDASFFSEEREQLLAEIDELLDETYLSSAKQEEMLAQGADLQAGFQASVAQVGELKAERETLRLSGDCFARAHAMELQVSAMTEEVNTLRDDNSELRLSTSRVPELEAKVENLANENERLVARIVEAQQEIEKQTQQRATKASATNHAPAGADCPESYLRTVLAAVGTPKGELQQAISGVETLLDEARRKLIAKG